MKKNTETGPFRKDYTDGFTGLVQPASAGKRGVRILTRIEMRPERAYY
jgi:hypothetical protein